MTDATATTPPLPRPAEAPGSTAPAAETPMPPASTAPSPASGTPASAAPATRSPASDVPRRRRPAVRVGILSHGTSQFDSRAHRIARSLAAAGDTVTLYS